MIKKKSIKKFEKKEKKKSINKEKPIKRIKIIREKRKNNFLNNLIILAMRDILVIIFLLVILLTVNVIFISLINIKFNISPNKLFIITVIETMIIHFIGKSISCLINEASKYKKEWIEEEIEEVKIAEVK